jgi:hypothetical protein
MGQHRKSLLIRGVLLFLAIIASTPVGAHDIKCSQEFVQEGFGEGDGRSGLAFIGACNRAHADALANAGPRCQAGCRARRIKPNVVRERTDVNGADNAICTVSDGFHCSR